jgi:membrane protease YdiL (CAAX protease family)
MPTYDINSRPGLGYREGFFILFGLLGAGFLLGGAAAGIVWSALTGKSLLSMEKAMSDPAYAGAVRVLQTVSTFFIFFLPAWATARILSSRPMAFLGYNRWFDWRVLGLALLIMLVCLPLVGALTELNRMIPVDDSVRKKFQALEDAYEKQVEVMSQIRSPWEFLVALGVMALGPAVFEETFFRGGMQNILYRWTGRLWPSVILTGILFSAIHFSFFGFIPRMALGIVLGLLYHYSGSLWMAIAGHFLNNAIVVAYIYYLTANGRSIKEAMDDSDPLWVGLVALTAMVCLFAYYRHFAERARRAKMPAEERALQEGWIA